VNSHFTFAFPFTDVVVSRQSQYLVITAAGWRENIFFLYARIHHVHLKHVESERVRSVDVYGTFLP